MSSKARIIEDGSVYRYFDRDGNELHDEDVIVYEDGREEKIYLTVDGKLGTDATNPHWIKTGKAYPCQYGIYPLTISELKEVRLKSE